MKRVSNYLFGSLLVIILISFITFSKAFAQSDVNSQKDKPYTVEYYYKAKWGYADEFLQLYKKNHYPVMKKEKELGRILSISIVKPRLHSTEDGRWDIKVIIVWKNISVTDDGYDEQALINQLYPDKTTHDKEEQRRFEILLAHWDLPIVDVDLDK
jgi:hypothetical protein